MRQPGTPLPAIDAEALQPLLDVTRQLRRPPFGVLEDQHADAPCLAVANRREADFPCPRSSVTQSADDRPELARRPMPEKHERDMQVISWNDPNADELLALPAFDLVEDAVGQAKREEEPELVIAAHASGGGYAASSRLPIRSARRR